MPKVQKFLRGLEVLNISSVEKRWLWDGVGEYREAENAISF